MTPDLQHILMQYRTGHQARSAGYSASQLYAAASCSKAVIRQQQPYEPEQCHYTAAVPITMDVSSLPN